MSDERSVTAARREAGHGAAAALSVALLDPNSHSLPYDRALAGALQQAGCATELITSPFLYERLVPLEGVRWRRPFFRLAAGGLARWLGLDRRAGWRRGVKALEYPIELAALAIWLLSRPPSIVHVQWSLAPALDTAVWRLLQRRGVSVVYTAHNLPQRDRTVSATRQRTLYQTADAIIVHTEATAARLIEQFGLPPERLHIAPHGPLLEEEPALPRSAARARLNLPTTAQIVLFAGLIEPYKGIDDLVSAFRLLAADRPHVQLVIAGRPNISMMATRQALAAAGLAERVHFDLRFLPQPALAAYLCAADVVALPYRATTASGLLMAARRFACPIVATAVGDLATTIAPERDGLLAPPGDPPALAAAIGRLLDDPALAARLGQAGRRRAQTEQSWEIAARQTLRAYRAALERR